MVLFAACSESAQHTEAATGAPVTETAPTATTDTAATAPATAAMYECPMKCEAPSAKPGKCSKCKMDLALVK